jgi:hypothetical protein
MPLRTLHPASPPPRKHFIGLSFSLSLTFKVILSEHIPITRVALILFRCLSATTTCKQKENTKNISLAAKKKDAGRACLRQRPATVIQAGAASFLSIPS